MKLYEYDSYDDYKRTQIQGNKDKLQLVWVTEENVKLVSDYILKHVPDPTFGICHGTRRGKEQVWFRKYLGIEVIGTEISLTGHLFPHTIVWDFHEVKDEWINNVDFIYSNSFDHSYKPKKCLDAWMSCIKKDGLCIIEWSAYDVKNTKLDPFGATLKEYKQLTNQKYDLKDVIAEPNTNSQNRRRRFFLAIKHPD